LGSAINVLNNKLMTYERNRAIAKDNLIQLEKDLEEKRKSLQNVNKNAEKIKLHKEEWTIGATKEEKFIAYKELKEFAQKKR
jgi:flagellar biosynthesis chaperone FliJ